ncbi:hypothetical protein [Actinotalea sp. C106]|uniref:hypothetical protein n=1 Tax=Actinotalea sp. C106 TaxID=2908644 RepID=UPI002027CB70|nr:hypothetical protein [Actinotalea sp. C106]
MSFLIADAGGNALIDHLDNAVREDGPAVAGTVLGALGLAVAIIVAVALHV